MDWGKKPVRLFPPDFSNFKSILNFNDHEKKIELSLNCDIYSSAENPLFFSWKETEKGMFRGVYCAKYNVPGRG